MVLPVVPGETRNQALKSWFGSWLLVGSRFSFFGDFPVPGTVTGFSKCLTSWFLVRFLANLVEVQHAPGVVLDGEVNRGDAEVVV